MYGASQLLDGLNKILSSRPRVTLAEAASALGVDRHTLERACGETGKTFRDRRRDAILARAEELLSGTPVLSVKEVAYRLGFESPAAFTQFTTRAIGRTPSQMKQKATQKLMSAPLR